MLRFIALGLTAFLAAPAFADPLPQGAFLLAAQPAPDFVLPRYVTLRIAGERMELVYSSPLPLDFEACDRGDGCIFSATGATATATLSEGRVNLTDIVFETDAPLDPSLPGPAHEVYVTPILGGLQGAILTETPGGFTIDTGTETWVFHALDAAQQAQVMAVPLFYELSIHALDGCEVAALAPLLQSDDPSPGAARFRAALASIAVSVEIAKELRVIAHRDADPQGIDRDVADRLLRLTILPMILSMSDPAGGPTLADAGWAGQGSGLFAGDRAAYDAALAEYGTDIDAHVALLRHLRETSPRITPETVCADPSLGFIAAND